MAPSSTPSSSSQRVRRRSLVILLTSVVDDVNAEAGKAIVDAMASRHLPLVVWLRDTGLERLVDTPRRTRQDVYDAGAAAELLVRREDHLAALRKRGALVIDAGPRVGEALPPFALQDVRGGPVAVGGAQPRSTLLFFRTLYLSLLNGQCPGIKTFFQ